MIRPLAACAALAAVLGFNAIAPAIAAPPTVVPSPGYDRRLVESRKALGSSFFATRARSSSRRARIAAMSGGIDIPDSPRAT